MKKTGRPESPAGRREGSARDEVAARRQARLELGEVDAIDLLAALATDLLIACRATYRTAPQSCANAIHIVTQALARHELLSASEEIEDAVGRL